MYDFTLTYECTQITELKETNINPLIPQNERKEEVVGIKSYL